MCNVIRFISGLIVLFLIILACNITAVQSGPILIRFSHVVGEYTPKGSGARMIQKLVAERLPGKVVVEIYPNSQKFTDGQAIRALLLGDIELAAPSFAKFRQFSTGLQVFDLPFLFDNVAQVHRFQASKVGQDLLSSMLGSNIKGLRYWDNGMRVVSSNKTIKTPADLHNLSVRIESSDVFYRQYKHLGAIPKPMAFKWLPDALRDGTVDAYENTWANIYSKSLHNLRPFFIETNHSFLGYMLITNNTFWNSLPADIRLELDRILDEVTIAVNRLALERAETDRRAIMQSDNVHVISLSEKERQLWKNTLFPVRRSFEPIIGQKIMASAIHTEIEPIFNRQPYLTERPTNN